MNQPHLISEQGRSTRRRFAAVMAPYMTNGKRIARALLPPLAPLSAPPNGRHRTIGYGGLALIAVTYTAIVFTYMFRLHNGEGTHGEDLGIMDQVLWNTTHGHFWQQTICNPISDVNCLGDVSRWAIHFEPSMLLLVPLYWFGGGPHGLQFVQVAGVAIGTLPAYWLGSRRLGHFVWGWALALAYLLMPMLYSAVTDDFHMVTLAAPALLFALYFLYTHNNRGLIIACLFALGTKEQVALDVLMLGFAAIALQRRYRLGLALSALAIGWAALALAVMHFASPLGASPTAVRYDGLQDTLARIPQLLLDPARRLYLAKLLLNAGGVGILAPWAVLLAAPSILLNALSNTPTQYSGQHQYNADIAPFLLIALLEGLVVARRLIAWAWPWLRAVYVRWLRQPSLAGMLALVTLGGLGLMQAATVTGEQVDEIWHEWPAPSAHTRLLPTVLAMIPAGASVSAQSELVPHLSHRAQIFQFPDGIAEAQYIVLDTRSDYYPEPDWPHYVAALQPFYHSHRYQVLYDHDGYILIVNHSPTASSDGP